jgi:N-acetylneuraminate synthase
MANKKTYIIAEVGVNHNGNKDLAFKLLDEVEKSGADCVKFQTFKADYLCEKTTLLADYQQQNTDYKSQYDMLKTLELPHDVHFDLKKEAARKNIDFLSTPFDQISLNFLVEELGLGKLKISSGDISNSYFLYNVALKEVDLIVSTGMASMADIELGLASLLWGYTKLPYPKSKNELLEILIDNELYDILRKKVSILHCTSTYPTFFEDVNLRAIQTIKNSFGLRAGYSDHSLGIEVPIAAVALGAEIIEKHFTLDKTMEGPDHKASLDPRELQEMVTSIRNIEKALGNKRKYMQSSEIDVKKKAQKRLVASKAIKIGEKLSLDNILVIRNNDGIYANEIWDVLGTISIKNYDAGDGITQ